MALTYAQFIAQYDQFASLSEAKVQAWLDMALLEVRQDLSESDLLTGLMTAHYLTISDAMRAGSVGGIQSINVVGEYSVSYAGSGATGDRRSSSSTSYLEEYFRILRSLGLTPDLV